MSKKCILAAVAVLVTSPALAHVTLETKQATVGSSYKAVFTVPHGCAGSATTKIRVQIPEGVIGVKPMPKAICLPAIRRPAAGITRHGSR